jgi:hypothetical protein
VAYADCGEIASCDKIAYSSIAHPQDLGNFFDSEVHGEIPVV